MRRGGRHHHRRARRRGGEDRRDVRAVRARGARDVSCPEARVRPQRAAQPRQGGAYAASLRRVRPHARARRAARAPRASALLMDAAAGALAETIRAAAEARQPLCIRGGGSKDFYGGEPRGAILDTRGCAGITAYEPSELVVSACGGTPLADLESVLAGQNQMLAFEPPHFAS